MKTMTRCCVLATLSGVVCVFNSLGAAPPGWLDRAFGNEYQEGAANYSLAGGQTNITIEAGGTDIWGKDDRGRYTFTPVAGDCEIIATVPFIPTNTTDYGEWVRAGVMMRGSTMHGAQNTSFFKVKGLPATGNRLKLQRRLTPRADSGDWPGGGNHVVAPDCAARIRLRRQGDTFTAWSSTNAPTYNQWTLHGTDIYAYPKAMNLGVAVSRWAQQPGGPNTFTHTFEDVVARKLVNAKGFAGGINLKWISDTPVTSGTIVGYTVNRAPVSTAVFAELVTLNAATSVYSDTTAGTGTSYVYRVNALVEVAGPATNTVLVGDSLQLRSTDSANPSPAPVQGIAAQYYDTTELVNPIGTRVEPYIYDSWTLGGTTVYPVGASSGLTSYDTFLGTWNGSVVVPESGCYEISMFVDDIANIYVNNERLVWHDKYMARDIFSAPFYLEAGRVYPFRADMREDSGGEAMRLNWFKADGTVITPVLMQSIFEPFPQPWQHHDLGDSPLMGNAHFNESDRSFNIVAGIGNLDNQHLVWQRSATDFDLLASATLNNPDAPGISAGLTARSSTALGSQAVSVALLSDGSGGSGRKIAVTIRDTNNGAVNTSSIALTESVADLRLSRRGNSLLACYRTVSSSGWVVATNLTITLPTELYVGMESHTTTAGGLATNTFRDVTFAEKLPSNLSVNVVNHEAQITTIGNPALVQQQLASQPAMRWCWYSAIAGVVDNNYTLIKSDHWDNNYATLATLNAGNNYSTVDPLVANTVTFYKLSYVYDLGAFADSSTNDMIVTSDRIGVSDGSIDAGGTGLYNAYYRGLVDNFPTNLPIHVQISGLNSWEKGTSTPMITGANSKDGQQVGPDNFACSWCGYITPPYTGWYKFRTRTDDSITLFVAGKKLIEDGGFAGEKQSADIYLEAGVSVPVYYYFQQGGGGGYFAAWWKTGVGTNAEWVTIPVTALKPLAPQDAPLQVDPAGANRFGGWKNIDIKGNPATGPGHVVLSGTPEAFDAKVVGAGQDVWGKADNFHYLYQETAENFELKGTINAVFRVNDWTKVGFMVRENVTPGSRHTSIIQSALQGRYTQFRNTPDQDSAQHDDVNRAMLNDGGTVSYTPTTFRIVRKGRKISFFLNDTPVPLASPGSFDFDISSWSSDTILAGLYVTSHDTDNTQAKNISEALYNDVTFTILHNKATLLILK
ncbi:MAG: PA14 domain-containing protein [Kiritimatiellae bacterium]|nr:PA14 domain-containing protein [Kiritimatiellia bacterium]